MHYFYIIVFHYDVICLIFLFTAFNSKELSKMKDWVRSMNGLWNIQPAQFAIEQVHNLSMADQKPGCCVCMIFFNEKVSNFVRTLETTQFTTYRYR